MVLAAHSFTRCSIDDLCTGYLSTMNSTDFSMQSQFSAAASPVLMMSPPHSGVALHKLQVLLPHLAAFQLFKQAISQRIVSFKAWCERKPSLALKCLRNSFQTVVLHLSLRVLCKVILSLWSQIRFGKVLLSPKRSRMTKIVKCWLPGGASPQIRSSRFVFLHKRLDTSGKCLCRSVTVGRRYQRSVFRVHQ